MKKLFMAFIIIFIVLDIASCSTRPGDSNQRIISPRPNVVPIEGEWKITKVISDMKKASNDHYDWINKNAEFSGKYIMVGDYILYDPSFKLRRVNPQEYLLYNHKSFQSELKITSKESEVITITGKDRFVCEALIINDNEIMLEIYNYNLLLKKLPNTTDETAEKVISKKLSIAKKTETNGARADNIIRTGVLIGLRSPIKETDNSVYQSYKYRTLWIASKNKKLHPILETENIFYPRKSGFWKMGVNTESMNKNKKDIIYSYNVSIGDKTPGPNIEAQSKVMTINVDVNNIINYVGNDYVSIENNNIAPDSVISKLQIIPIDSLPNLRAVKIVDLASNNITATTNLNENYFDNIYNKYNNNVLDRGNLDTNFGLIRKAGHWYFEGRVDYKINNKISYADYRINLIPPSNLVFYDELSITWTDIKEKVPDAVDAYTSPNKDLAIILSKNNKILIYEINKGVLGKQPIKVVKLRQDEKIIMAEWATGSYVDNWGKTFIAIK